MGRNEHNACYPPAMTFIERVRFQTVEADSPLPAEADARLARFLEYWRGKAGEGLPRRRAIEPMEIVALLPSVFLIDVLPGAEGQSGEQAPEDFRFSLIGEEVLDRYGPLRGRTLREQMSDAELHRTLEEHRLCVTARLPVYVVNSERTAADGDGLLYQRLLLPLTDDSDAVTSLAGIMVFQRYT